VLLKSLCQSFNDVSGVVGVVDAGCAGQMGFFLFLAGKGFFPRRVAESCVCMQADTLLIVACVLGWNG
jgi:hypothetical protein